MSNYTYQRTSRAHNKAQKYDSEFRNYSNLDKDNIKLGHYVSETDISIRMAFVRKVYSILTLQLIGTVISSYLVTYSYAVKFFFQTNPGLLLFTIALGFISLMALNYKAKSYPLNVILLSIFTLSESVLLGCIVSISHSTAVLQALILTLGIFIGLTVFTMQSKYDFSQIGPILALSAWGLLILSSVQMFIPFSSSNELKISVFAVFLFSGYIMYDTHMIMNRYTPDDYIIASVSLYLDVINLFIRILDILDKESRRNKNRRRAEQDSE
ncbi:hypothetical protein BB559_002461 [Furculomyces boomerangus]|uniref:Bax inhibitor 1 n=1 Tax=Furculomyces boomerangus TaxID=61424 RepID=A0A2T9YV63_9FUNG|nr:hypothetical protein BB559_002461 [Furculomyces boomerangus]